MSRNKEFLRKFVFLKWGIRNDNYGSDISDSLQERALRISNTDLRFLMSRFGTNWRFDCITFSCQTTYFPSWFK